MSSVLDIWRTNLVKVVNSQHFQWPRHVIRMMENRPIKSPLKDHSYSVQPHGQGKDGGIILSKTDKFLICLWQKVVGLNFDSSQAGFLETAGRRSSNLFLSPPPFASFPVCRRHWFDYRFFFYVSLWKWASGWVCNVCGCVWKAFLRKNYVEKMSFEFRYENVGSVVNLIACRSTLHSLNLAAMNVLSLKAQEPPPNGHQFHCPILM